MCAGRLDHVVRTIVLTLKTETTLLQWENDSPRLLTADEITLYIMAWVLFEPEHASSLSAIMRKKVQRRSEKNKPETTADKSRKHEATKHFSLFLLLPLYWRSTSFTLLIKNLWNAAVSLSREHLQRFLYWLWAVKFITVYQCIQINGLLSVWAAMWSSYCTVTAKFSLIYKGCFNFFFAVAAENHWGKKTLSIFAIVNWSI